MEALRPAWRRLCHDEQSTHRHDYRDCLFAGMDRDHCANLSLSELDIEYRLRSSLVHTKRRFRIAAVNGYPWRVYLIQYR